MTIRFAVARPHELAPYVESLRVLERDIPYPIADGADEFRIDHGNAYHPFFSEMGESFFVLALDGERVVGTVTGVHRQAMLRARATKVLYAADLKIARDHRGGALARRLLSFAARSLFTSRGGLSWRLAYVAAMRGKHGDVTRTVRGVHLGKVARPLAELSLYFVAPQELAALDVTSAPAPLRPRHEDGIDLSPPRAGEAVDAPGFVTTAGKKDLRLRSTGAPWPLVHLRHGPADASPSWPSYLKSCGEAMLARGLLGPACFGVDARLTDHVAWLSRRALEPAAACNIHALSLTLRTRGAAWLHLATSEI